MARSARPSRIFYLADLPLSLSGAWLFPLIILKSMLTLYLGHNISSNISTSTSRMMATPHNMSRPSFIGVARQIYNIDGYRGYFRGLMPCLLRAFPVNASALWVYEGLMRVLGAEKVNFIESFMVPELTLIRGRLDIEFPLYIS